MKATIQFTTKATVTIENLVCIKTITPNNEIKEYIAFDDFFIPNTSIIFIGEKVVISTHGERLAGVLFEN